jgi:hypothetical protein
MPHTCASGGLSAIARIAMPVRLYVRKPVQADDHQQREREDEDLIWTASARPGSSSTLICNSRV